MNASISGAEAGCQGEVGSAARWRRGRGTRRNGVAAVTAPSAARMALHRDDC
uniref:hypothetical protein n=1 Tax=Rhodococcus tibetensis TaxID=2965064 RepID=UPI0035AC0F25